MLRCVISKVERGSLTREGHTVGYKCLQANNASVTCSLAHHLLFVATTQSGGPWDPITNRFAETDPRQWDDKHELERSYWMEKYAGDLAEGYNPIGQYDGIKGGQTLEVHTRIRLQEQQRKQSEVRWFDHPLTRPLPAS